MSQTTHFKYKMEDVECKFCTEYRGKKRGCAHAVCPWLAERIEAGVVGYEEALLDSFPHNPRLGAKLRTAVQLFHGSLWLNEGHRQRMETLKAREGFQRRRDTPAYFAAMYLLTADPDTANRTATSPVFATSIPGCWSSGFWSDLDRRQYGPAHKKRPRRCGHTSEGKSGRLCGNRA